MMYASEKGALLGIQPSSKPVLLWALATLACSALALTIGIVQLTSAGRAVGHYLSVPTQIRTAHTAQLSGHARVTGNRMHASANLPAFADLQPAGAVAIDLKANGSQSIGPVPMALMGALAGIFGWWMHRSRSASAMPPLLTMPMFQAGLPEHKRPTWQMAAAAAETVGKVAVQIKLADVPATAFSGPTLVYMVTEDLAGELQLPEIQKEEFKGKDGQVTMAYDLPNFAAPRVLLIGLGEPAKVNAHKLRCSVNTIMKELKARKLSSAAVSFPEPALEGDVSPAGLVATTAILTDYFYDVNISDKERCFHVEELTLLTSTPAFVVEEQVNVTHGTVLTRDLLNTRADIATPEWMANFTVEMCKDFPEIELRVVDFEEMEEKGMNLVRAVGKGAVHKPCIVYMHYKGDPESTKSLALVGKGLCFDTGGLNLKPTGSIEQMHLDKGGACAVLGTMHAIATQKLKTNVVGVVAFAENAIGKDACKPYEILKSYKGLTVLNKNTDAEGRLVLADAMTYLQKEYEVDQMFTIATLTGAIVLALGFYTTGMFTQSDATAAALTAASIPGDERVWRMPLYEEYADQLKGTYSDLHSTGTARWGGACTAAAFLSKFAEEGVEFTHLDIAGTAGDLISGDDRPWIVKGATGWGPSILYHYIKHNRCT